MPSIATICQAGREVWCEKGNPECEAVALAVQAIDEVVPGLLVYRGELEKVALIALFNKTPGPRLTVVVRGDGVPADYKELAIAMTLMAPEPRQACLGNVPIILVWPSAALSTVEWRQVVLHEMLHSLGFNHASESCPYSTVMRPALSQERRVGLSKADANALRAVYGGA